MSPLSQLILLTASTLSIAQHNHIYACESLICDPPKMCVVQNQVAQCLLILAPTPKTTQPNLGLGGIVTRTTTSQNLLPSLLVGFAPTQRETTIQQLTTTTNTAPLAPFPNIFGGVVGGSPQISLPSLPPPPTTTTVLLAQICTLPPLTGNCSRARIMWYYDNETGKCERFSFSGCGNLNRFSSKTQCEQSCSRQG